MLFSFFTWRYSSLKMFAKRKTFAASEMTQGFAHHQNDRDAQTGSPQCHSSLEGGNEDSSQHCHLRTAATTKKQEEDQDLDTKKSAAYFQIWLCDIEKMCSRRSAVSCKKLVGQIGKENFKVEKMQAAKEVLSKWFSLKNPFSNDSQRSNRIIA